MDCQNTIETVTWGVFSLLGLASLGFLGYAGCAYFKGKGRNDEKQKRSGLEQEVEEEKMIEKKLFGEEIEARWKELGFLKTFRAGQELLSGKVQEVDVYSRQGLLGESLKASYNPQTGEGILEAEYYTDFYYGTVIPETLGLELKDNFKEKERVIENELKERIGSDGVEVRLYAPIQRIIKLTVSGFEPCEMYSQMLEALKNSGLFELDNFAEYLKESQDSARLEVERLVKRSQVTS